jgi:hypothetical protein
LLLPSRKCVLVALKKGIMKQSIGWLGVLVGALTSLVVMALAYLGNLLLALPFFPFDLFDWLTRHLPGVVIEFTLRLMISLITVLHLGPTASTAKLAEQIQSLGLVVLTGVVFGWALSWLVGQQRRWIIFVGTASGLLLWIAVAFVELSLHTQTASQWIGLTWLLLLLTGWGWGMARFLKAVSSEVVLTISEPATSTVIPQSVLAKKLTRRNLLALAGTSAISAVVLLVGLEKFRQTDVIPAVTPLSARRPSDVPPTGSIPFGPEYTSGPAASPSPAALAARITPAPGTRPEVTNTGDLYRIDINTVPPKINANTWHLELTGLVKQPMSFTLDQIRAFPSVSQAVTLSCISNLVGGDLIGTTFWTGVRVKDVLNEAGLLPNATEIAMQSADGYYEGMNLKEAMDDRSLFVYAINGQTLSSTHGFPLRLYVPDRYGMRLPKWLTSLKAIDGPNRGYWTARGWSAEAVPMTTSVIDTIYDNPDDFKKTGVVPLGGIAWAGDRLISKVEVQIDGGPWFEAQLRDPALSPLTWVQWRYDWKATPGLHQVKVRATDGKGIPQETSSSFPSPEGATGIDSVTITI